MNNLFFEKMFVNQPYKAKQGIVYVSPVLAVEFVDLTGTRGGVNDKYQQALITNEQCVILVINALSGTLAEAARDRWPNARVVCVEYFPFEVKALKKRGFEVVYLEQDTKNYNLTYMNSKLQEEIKQNGIACVLGNPPYQDNTNGNGNNIKLWTKFVELSNDIVLDGAVVSFITPLTWQAPISRVNPVRQLFNENNLIWVDTKVNRYFDGVGSTFSAWIYRKGPHSIPSTTVDGVEVDLTYMLYVPLAEHLPIHQTIVFNNSLPGFNVMGDETANVILTKKNPTLLSREKTATHTHEAFHTNRQSLWSSRPLKDETSTKVVFTTSGYVKPFLDNGQVGVSNTSRYILVKDVTEGESIVSQLKCKAYQFIMETAKWGGFVNVNVIKALPLLDTSKVWDDESVYNHFKLSPEERALIEATVK